MPLNLADGPLHALIAQTGECLTTIFAELPPAARAWLAEALPRARAALTRDGRVAEWQAALAALPALTVEQCSLGPTVGACGPCEPATREALRAALMALSPWRKGPFALFDVLIDSEWRSDWKWARVLPHVRPLAGRRVLDVGCGNGYYLWRMAQAGARLVLGVDPALHGVAQFAALRRYLLAPAVHLLPLASADLDNRLRCFDTVFSMGVLYHRRDHLAHLGQLHAALRSGGELVLETLVMQHGCAELLKLKSRYAAMRNVRAVPAPATVEAWLQQSGFDDVRTVDISRTDSAEQRTTAWMPYHSLRDFLAPDDATRTIEGHAAPLRAVFVATAR